MYFIFKYKNSLNILFVLLEFILIIFLCLGNPVAVLRLCKLHLAGISKCSNTCRKAYPRLLSQATPVYFDSELSFCCCLSCWFDSPSHSLCVYSLSVCRFVIYPAFRQTSTLNLPSPPRRLWGMPLNTLQPRAVTTPSKRGHATPTRMREECNFSCALRVSVWECCALFVLYSFWFLIYHVYLFSVSWPLHVVRHDRHGPPTACWSLVHLLSSFALLRVCLSLCVWALNAAAFSHRVDSLF